MIHGQQNIKNLVKLLSLLISTCQCTIISWAWGVLEFSMMIIKFLLHPFYGTLYANGITCLNCRNTLTQNLWDSTLWKYTVPCLRALAIIWHIHAFRNMEVVYAGMWNNKTFLESVEIWCWSLSSCLTLVYLCANRSQGINRNCPTSNHNPSCSQSHVNIKECLLK